MVQPPEGSDGAQSPTGAASAPACTDGDERIVPVPQPRQEPHRRLVELLDDPRESPAVEIKNWVDLNNRVVAADIARGLLALANHGGGTMIIGFDETPAGCVPSGDCPHPLSTYSQDAINAICARYADP